jgi:hypothetical protein
VANFDVPALAGIELIAKDFQSNLLLSEYALGEEAHKSPTNGLHYALYRP